MIGFTINLKKRNTYIRSRKKKRKKYIYLVPVIVIAVFSVIVAEFAKKNESQQIISETENIQVFKEINDFSAYYNPVVMNGFFSYSKGDKIEKEKLLQIAVWSILSTEKKEKYELFDGRLSIPEEEVKKRIKQLFSEDMEYENTSTENIFFDERSKCYNVPTMGFFSEYSGILKSVTAEKDKTRLLVECFKSDAFKQDSSGKTVFPEAEKNVIIELRKSKESYYIVSIYEE